MGRGGRGAAAPVTPGGPRADVPTSCFLASASKRGSTHRRGLGGGSQGLVCTSKPTKEAGESSFSWERPQASPARPQLRAGCQAGPLSVLGSWPAHPSSAGPPGPGGDWGRDACPGWSLPCGPGVFRAGGPRQLSPLHLGHMSPHLHQTACPQGHCPAAPPLKPCFNLHRVMCSGRAWGSGGALLPGLPGQAHPTPE